MSDQPASVFELQRLEKATFRRHAEQRRLHQPNKDRLSRVIGRRFSDLPEYRDATTLLCYLHIRNEVRTRFLIESMLATDKDVVIPYCVGDDLQLFHLLAMEELAPGEHGILEPKDVWREAPDRKVPINRIDLAMVPGVAFDTHGVRLGHGLGYYDRLLQKARGETLLVGLAFACQIFPALPCCDYDVPMDRVVTETAIYYR